MSQVDWISEKANIIAVMDKSSGVHLYVAGSTFQYFKSWTSGEKSTKTEASREEQKLKIKLKRPEISVFTWSKKRKKVSRGVKLEIRFHRYETRIKSFQVKKTLLKLVFCTYTTPLLLPTAVLAPAPTIF